jgi:hypothetical protein
VRRRDHDELAVQVGRVLVARLRAILVWFRMTTSAPTGTATTGRVNDSPTTSQLTWAGAVFDPASLSRVTTRYGARLGFLISASGFSIRSTKPRAITGPRSGGGGSSSLPTTVPAWTGPARAAMPQRIPTEKPRRMGLPIIVREPHSRRQAAAAAKRRRPR